MNSNTSTREETLINNLKRKDTAAFGDLYDRYGAALFGVVVRIVQSDSLAEDVIQESFVKIWNKIDQYDASKGSFFTWILNITRNTAIDHWRKAERRKTEDIEPALAAGGAQYETSPENTLDTVKILEQLGEPEKTLMYMSYLEGYSQREIAKKLDLPLGTVKTKMRKSLRVLRDMFA